MLFVLSITACEKEDNNVAIPTEETSNEGEDTVRGMVSKLDEMDEKSSKTKHVDLVEDIGVDTKDLGTCITGVAKDEEEKTNDEGDGKSSKSVNTTKPKSSKKNK